MTVRPALILRRACASTWGISSYPIRSLIAAPTPNSGPLMERRPDRALPSIKPARKFLKTLPIFIGLMTASALCIFNYQKSSSPVVTSTLYALRTNAKARQLLGDEIYFAQQVPWIWGEMNQLHGRIDINFMVKGTKTEARVWFKCTREKGKFLTKKWNLEFSDGTVVQLLEDGQADPLSNASI